MYSQDFPILAYTLKDCITVVNIKGWLDMASLTLAGATVYLSIKETLDSDDVLFTIDVTSFLDEANGDILIQIPRSNLNIQAKNYFYELTFQEPDGDSSTIKQGDFILQKSIKTSL